MPYRSKAIPGIHEIDGQTIRTDSKMEAQIIQRLAKNGFSGKWRRTAHGTSFGYSNYTADVELSVSIEGADKRALVEFKSTSANEFSKRARERMLASAHYYSNTVCYLYIEKTKNWYFVLPGGKFQKTAAPTPGNSQISLLPAPKLGIPIINKYGRFYFAKPAAYIGSKIANALDFTVRAIIPIKVKKRRRK